MSTKQTKRYWWVCPICRDGVLAPKSIRKDNAKRICLPCTGKTGKLTYRTIPSIVKAKTAKAVREKAKAQAKREREAKKKEERETVKYTHCGIDLRTEFLWIGRTAFIEKSEAQWDRLVKKLECRKTVRGWGRVGNANVYHEGKEKGRIFLSTSGYDSLHVLYNLFWCMTTYVVKTSRKHLVFRHFLLETVWRAGYLTTAQYEDLKAKEVGMSKARFTRAIGKTMDHPPRLLPLYEQWCRENPTLVP